MDGMRQGFARALVAGLTTALMALFALGQAQAEPLIEASYDPAIPSIERVLGHESGMEITSPADILTYLAALQKAAPDRMRIVQYATSWEGRPLVYAVIASPETIARLPEVQADLARLGSGEALAAGERDALIARTPAVTWLSYGVHGNEISSSDAALALAYHLLAARGDARVDSILANTIVVIDPSQNPDGRARFVSSFEQARGLVPFADRYAAEHDEPWPGGRFNHYLFDLNRDWFALTQPETRGKVAAVRQWHPVVYVDAHEMGGDETYFFPPSADPFNPNITADQRAKQDLLGRNHAAWFDRLGIPYFTREVYDAFYPGYGDMWPALNGATAMTFEQASARGLAFRRRDGSLLTYRDGVRNHFIGTLSAAETVAANKARFLGDYAAYRRAAVADGAAARERYFVIDLAERRGQAEALGRRLAMQGIAVQRLASARQLCGRSYPMGALIVDKAQPSGRLIKALLDRDTPLPPDFIAEQESRRDRGLDHELYDVTAWSLGLMDGVSVRACAGVSTAGAEPVTADSPVPALADTGASFGVAVPWSDSAQARLVLAALARGLKARASEEAFTLDGRRFPRGTAIFAAGDNPADYEATLVSLARAGGGELVPLASSWVTDGPNFGSDKFASLPGAPRVAMAWGDGVGPTSAGATRYVLERDLGLPVAPIRAGSIARAELGRYDVLILPDSYGDLADELGKGGMEAIKAFVRGGGVVVGFGGSVELLASKDLGLLSTRVENAVTEGDAPKDDDPDEGAGKGTVIDSEAAYRARIADREASPEDVPGVLVNTVADPDHWLASGYDGGAVALVTGSRIYRPLNEGDGTNVLRFAGPSDLLASGYLWDENRKQLAFKPFVMAEPAGGGLAIGFTQEPTTRAYLHGLTLLLANAVLLGPAHTR